MRKGPVGGLIFYCGVPPAVVVEDMVGPGEVKADPPPPLAFRDRMKNARGSRIVLEPVYHRFPLGLGGTTVEEEGVVIEGTQDAAAAVFPTLQTGVKIQGSVSLGGHNFKHFRQPLQFGRTTL